MRRTAIVVPALIVGMIALVLVGGATAKKPALSATPVFKLHLKPSQEVPPIKGLKADAVGSVTFDLTRNAPGAITAGEVVFYFNYKFPGSVTISGSTSIRARRGRTGASSWTRARPSPRMPMDGQRDEGRQWISRDLAGDSRQPSRVLRQPAHDHTRPSARRTARADAQPEEAVEPWDCAAGRRRLPAARNSEGRSGVASSARPRARARRDLRDIPQAWRAIAEIAHEPAPRRQLSLRCVRKGSPPQGQEVSGPYQILSAMESSFPSVRATGDSSREGTNWAMVVGLLVCLAFWGAVALGIVAVV